ncbi:HEAT repeat domain-containing protein [Streptomyces klenkii]|uniref:NACHT domain-containing protein n=1 Tax=Streptomyces klenkii TaxID=1420899 RepID=UPI0033BD62AE
MTDSGSPQVSARGNGALGAGGDATYNATGKGSSVHDNRTYVIVNGSPAGDSNPLSSEEISSALAAYAKQIKTSYGRLDLEALMPTSEGEHPRVQLREVFVPPLLRADPPRVELPVELHRRLIECGELPNAKADGPGIPGVDRQIWERARQAYRDRPAVKLLDTLADAESGRVVLLGDPGAGKSTLARYLALALTSGALTGPLERLSGLLPVVVELRRYADADWRERSFEDFLAHVHKHEGHAPAPALLRHRLENGQALVVFDGLDELFDPRVRDDVTRRIAGFTARYPSLRVVVTSRVIGYDRHTLDAADFRHYMIQSLDDEQIATFTSNWYEAVCPVDKQEAGRLRTRLTEAIAASRPVRELAGNPLLLTILAIIARRQRLPRDRAGVYQHAVNVLIARWDEDTKHLDLSSDIRAIADLDDRDRQEMLELLARHMQSGEAGIAGNHVLAEDVEDVFTTYLRATLQLDLAPAKKVARAMVKQFRERNFILSRYGSQVYGFVHRAFLEYLAASDIVRRYGRRELTDEELLDGIFARRAPDPAWHEVLLLIAGQVSERVAAQAIDKILEGEIEEKRSGRAPLAVLALRALTEVRRIGTLTDQSIKTAAALTRYWDQQFFIPPSAHLETENSLNSLGPQWVGSRHILRWLHAPENQIHSTLPAYGLYTEASVLMVIAEHALEPAARTFALTWLAKKWPHESKVLSLIQQAALYDSDYIVRSDALNILARGWAKDHPSVFGLIRDRATEDADSAVRGWALVALARHWSEDPTVRDLIQKRATQDTHEHVRSNALDTLALHWSKDPIVRDLIQKRATQDTHEHIRSNALDTLARHWSKDPTVRDLIQKRATQDTHEHIRSNALDTLARHWSKDPTVRDLIQKRATQDTHEHVRSRALGTLALCWSEDPTVRDLIQKRATQDTHEHVRSRALGTLALCWSEDPTVRDLIQKRATQDTHKRVRQEALDTLAWHWPEKPTARMLAQDLRKRALHDASDTCRDSLLDALINGPHLEVRIEAARLLASFWSAAPQTIPALRAQQEDAPDDKAREAFAQAAATAEAYAPLHDRLW